jgi:hypothetical protein
MNANRNNRIIQLAIWTWSWVGSLALATFGSLMWWPSNSLLKIGLILLNTILGIGMIRANIKLLQDYDELEKKIHLESMGLTLGLGVVFGLSYALLDTVDIINWDAEIGILIGFMGITYLATVLWYRKKYS